MSLSARRAWIEMVKRTSGKLEKDVVALRKESVDRNAYGVMPVSLQVMSLSARRAWIEIRLLTVLLRAFSVALRKESVDRNLTIFRA